MNEMASMLGIAMVLHHLLERRARAPLFRTTSTYAIILTTEFLSSSPII